MKNKTIIIFGSARNRGYTWDAINAVYQPGDITIVNLNDCNISDFDYEMQNQNDDFIPLIEKMLTFDQIILATPVYWYTMSVPMKRFVDRWSDLLFLREDLGAKLQGKRLGAITSYGTYPDGNMGFEQNFQLIAEYMQMEYSGCYFYYSGENQEIMAQNQQRADEFQEKLRLIPAEA